jgi:hypothetical protein
MIDLAAGLDEGVGERPRHALPWERSRYRLWSLWDMLQNYLPIYQITLDLQRLRSECTIRKDLTTLSEKMQSWHSDAFQVLLETLLKRCPDYGFTHTAELAKKALSRPLPGTYADMFSALTYLDDSLGSELENESVFRIPPERKGYFEPDELFGEKVAVAFPSCARDIQKAGSCYAMGQEDACVHHLMLVLERGLNALAAKLKVPYQRTNWQDIIDRIRDRLKSRPRDTDHDFYRKVNAEFGFLKDAYRNHSEHAHDDPYDMEKALSILNHVRDFMRELEKGGLSE